MENETLAFIVSFIAMLLIALSYFFKKKSWLLLFQTLGIVFLILSYLFTAQYFATVGLSVGLIRTLTFYAYEQRGKDIPIVAPIGFSVLTVAVYFTINFGVLKNVQPLDILYLGSLIGYAFAFYIKKIQIMRYVVLLPITLAILFNAFTHAPIFVVVSYSFELGANVLAIFKYYIFDEQEKQAQTK